MSEIETIGSVSDVNETIGREHRVYRIAIFGDEAARIHALTQIIAMPCVSVVINTGEAMDGKITLSSRKSSSAKKVIKSSKSARSRIKSETIN
jgi:hypothetical protein